MLEHPLRRSFVDGRQNTRFNPVFILESPHHFRDFVFTHLSVLKLLRMTGFLQRLAIPASMFFSAEIRNIRDRQFAQTAHDIKAFCDQFYQ